ncbi:hypothetical protein ABZU76_12695 [Amycolatopsis sp. NPDC005232]|uniref:hypothetical protein n=1 Tax=Amycolatopsis sp. NPDC005232 TaxID=3157027 RepID=UPI0033A70601
MSVQIVGSPASAGDTAARRCEYYRLQCGLPVRLVEDNRIVLRLGGALGAVTMPAELGDDVGRSLLLRSAAAPAIVHPGGKRWTFLTGPGSATLDHVQALVPLGLSVVGDGAWVVLPSPETEALGMWVWARGSAWTEPPAQATVLATACALAVQKQGRRGPEDLPHLVRSLPRPETTITLISDNQDA